MLKFKIIIKYPIKVHGEKNLNLNIPISIQVTNMKMSKRSYFDIDDISFRNMTAGFLFVSIECYKIKKIEKVKLANRG